MSGLSPARSARGVTAAARREKSAVCEKDHAKQEGFSLMRSEFRKSQNEINCGNSRGVQISAWSARNEFHSIF